MPFLHIPQDVQEKEKPKFAKRAPHWAHWEWEKLYISQVVKFRIQPEMWLNVAYFSQLLVIISYYIRFLSHRLCLRIFSLSKVLEGHYNSTVGDRLKVKNTFRPWYRVSGTGGISYHSSIISLYHHFKESFINIIICITSWCMLNPLEFLSMRFQSLLAFPCFSPLAFFRIPGCQSQGICGLRCSINILRDSAKRKSRSP